VLSAQEPKVAAIVSGDWWATEAYRRKSLTTPLTPGNAENADIAASAGNGKRRAPNAKRFPISTNQRDAI
jgi:hypothetical protein